MLVNLLDGCVQAKNVAPGSAMWTLDGDRTVQTTVVDVVAAKARAAVDVVTDHMTFSAFRVRVVSSYLSDALRHYVGGDAHHMRQRFPRVVLRDIDTFEGFLDGYIEGDGCPIKGWNARVITSANVPFLAEIAPIIGARFTPRAKDKGASRLCVSDRWASRGTFAPEHHRIDPPESSWVQVHEVRPRPALGTKPFTFYSYRLAPYPTFLVNGHLAREPW
ncbi:hypothetical protein ACFVID_34155 [Streptomyces sp. NPDC127132]|uniref:hypothetical protein n=1 Tax=Streptomyces sp. NPDC127132 TaxID=3345374 RepID=UPI003629234A